MEKISKIILLLSTVFLFTSQVAADMAQGDNEVQLSGGFFHAQDSDSGTLTAEGHYGYYLTPGWEVGLKQSINSSFVDGGGDTWTASTIPFVQYNFHDHNVDDKIVPFLGAFAGAAYNDRDITGTVGPTAGAKFFLYDKTYLALQYRYEWFFNDLDLGSFSDDVGTIRDNSSDGNHVASIGLGVLW